MADTLGVIFVLRKCYCLEKIHKCQVAGGKKMSYTIVNGKMMQYYSKYRGDRDYELYYGKGTV